MSLYPIFMSLYTKTEDKHVRNVLKEWYKGNFVDSVFMRDQTTLIVKGKKTIPLTKESIKEVSAIINTFYKRVEENILTFHTIEEITSKSIRDYYVKKFVIDDCERKGLSPRRAQTLLLSIDYSKISPSTVIVQDSKIVSVDLESLKVK